MKIAGVTSITALAAATDKRVIDYLFAELSGETNDAKQLRKFYTSTLRKGTPVLSQREGLLERRTHIVQGT